MLTNPQQRRVDERFVSKKLIVVAIALAVLLSLIGDFLLLSFKSGEQSAVAGQLLQGGEVARSSFMSYVFDYFGSVTYLFPWITVYVVVVFANRGFSLKQLDLFRLGIRLLGLNTLLIGSCMLFSGLVGGNSLGAGGILGDYLNLACFGHLPRFVAPFIPVLITYAGILLSAVHSPLWLCDVIGQGIMNLIPVGSKEENETKTTSQAQKNTTKAERSSLFHFSQAKANTEKKDPSVNAGFSNSEEEPPRFFRGDKDQTSQIHIGSQRENATNHESHTERVEPSFGIENEEDRSSLNLPNESSFQNTVTNRSQNENYARNSYQDEHYRSTGSDRADLAYSQQRRANEQSAIERNSYASARQNYLNASARRQERIFTQDSVDITQGKRGFDALYQRANAEHHESNQDNAPSTIISGGTYANNYAQRYDDIEDPQYEDDGVQRTIITKNAFTPVAKTQNRSSEYVSGKVDDYKGPIYQAGAPGVNNEVVGNPVNRGEVSTVITRGQSVTKMQYGQSVESYERPEESPAGTFDELKSSASLPSSSDVLMPQDLNEDNATFSFTDDEYEQDDYGEQGPLRQSADPISERDQSYSSSYTMATRGLGEHAEVVDLAKHEHNVADETSYAIKDQSNPQQNEQYESYNQERSLRVQSAQQENKTRVSSEHEVSHSDSMERDEQYNDYQRGVQHNNHQQDSTQQENSQQDRLAAQETEHADISSAQYDDVAQKDLGVTNTDTKQNASVEYDAVPTAPLTKVPTKDYVCSVATVPTRSDLNDTWRPDFSLLQSSNEQAMVDEDSIRSMIVAINRTFVDFNVQAEVAAYQAGPVITRYDLKLGRGTRTSSIRQLQTDISRSLTTSVRVIDVVPGTSYMGLEIPNPKRKFFTLRDVVESQDFIESKDKLPLCLGVNAIGQSVIADLATAPHLLIAGTTGSGKSAGINSMMLSLLLKLSPAQLRFMLIDPKTVEFSRYEDLPHLICPVITDMDKIMAGLQWCVDEMQRRYELIANLKFRSVSEYNAYIKRKNEEGERVFDPAWSPEMGGHPSILKPLPAIVIVIDEFADLMAAFEGRGKSKDPSPDRLVQRIAQKARAASMHLLVATQSPRSSVITGTLKANLPSRIAYTVQSGLDSRVILDEGGAENLLGNGDMLAKFMGLYNNQLFRAHGPFASNEDVNAVVSAWKEHCGEPEYVQGVTDLQEDLDEGEISLSSNDRAKKLDPLYETIVAYVRDYQNQNNGNTPSITQMQVDFGIGYPRTKKILAQMKKNGDL